VLDYSARQARLGKTIGDDFREGKITLPVILAMERGSEEERGFWRRTLEDGEQAEQEDLDHAVALLQRHDALADSMAAARVHAENAIRAIRLLPASPMRTALEDVVEFVVERDF
jgi:octaprenyl-diphosphate synthase